jgi:hypothetical protein
MMTRFSRTAIGAVVFVVTSFFALSASAANAPAFSVVYPTGVFPDDVKNVQAAVDKGGIVFLKAFNAAHVPTTFNFSTDVASAHASGSVNLTTDVSIIGERIGKVRATISGGFDRIVGTVPVKSSIQGLDFESPFTAAIFISASTGCDIINNIIHHVVPIKVLIPDGEIITFGDGIDFFEENTSITGKVRVIGNVIDGLGANFSNGMQFDTAGAESEISGNTILNINSPDSESGGGITLVRLRNSTLVTNNLIVTGASQTSFVDGIFIGGDIDARYTVLANRIVNNSPNGDGIDMAGGEALDTLGMANAVVAGNDITTGGPGAFTIAVFDLVTDSLIAGNDIHGNRYFALGVTTQGFETQIASLNRFIDNRLDNSTSAFADVFFDANAENNLLIGKCKTLIDLGVGNSSTCGEPLVSAAQAFTLNVVVPNETSSAAASTAMQAKRQAHLKRLTLLRQVRSNRSLPLAE